MPRRGAAFVMLVVLLLLLIIATAQTLITSELSLRRSESAAERARSMATAIQRLSRDDFPPNTALRLPVDTGSDQWIEVAINGEMISARWLRGDQLIDELSRPLTTESVE